ncbi:hypothetical protein [Alistipes sp.]|uniref:hypothetical protein n=1 Tax=Alistipes sp. TaxID=1872444 RepID=UPI0025BDB215|nr:hypothetical protein [Alistipes sp.]
MNYLPILFLVFAVACGDTQPPSATETLPAAGIYHWKTTFSTSGWESAFMERHRIGRLYLRFFDVDLDRWNPASAPQIVPVGTTRFPESPGSGMLVTPTVFITVEALQAMKGQTADYAEKITGRIMAMSRRHDMLRQIREVQIDCDWTRSTQTLYFDLLREIRTRLQKDSIRLGATIRLHQLHQAAPPVDRGMLMLYNTGNVRDDDTRNSILDEEDVAPYLRRKPTCDLPLDFAYPVFAWGIWFRDGAFKAILHHTDFSDPDRYEPIGNNIFRVRKSHFLENHQLRPDDRIRLDAPNPEQILRVKQRVERLYATAESAVVLYHLDSLHLSQFTDHEIEALYRR